MQVGRIKGSIICLDALGIRSSSIEESELYAQKLSKLADTISTFEDDGDNMHNVAQSVHIMGDTIVVCIYSGEKSRKKKEGHYFLNLATNLATKIMIFGLQNGLLLRGAISAGEYIVCNNGRTLVGPAITDAVSWYDKADWAGVILTPTTGYLHEISGVQAPEFYPVPMKTNKTQNLRCCIWPCYVYQVILSRIQNPKDKKSAYRKQIIKWLGLNSKIIPYGVESKYENTLKFVDHCLALIESNTDSTTKIKP